MDLYEELVNGPGYAVCSIKNMQLFKETRDSLIDKVNVSADPEKNIDAVEKPWQKCLRQKSIRQWLVCSHSPIFPR